MGLVEFLLVGLAAGWILGKLRRGKGYGLIGNVLVGMLGALIGGFIGGFMGVATTNFLGSIAMAVLGAIVFFLIVDALRPKKKKNAVDGEEE